MELSQILESLSKNKKVSVKNVKEDSILINLDGSVLVISPKLKFAEFLDIAEDWEELQAALEDEYYKDFPEIKRLYEYMVRNKYDIIF